VGPFSGGERARLALALIVRRRPNLLLLDEPTNHLDIDLRHALTLALQEYEGAVVLVSHDRHLLRTSADELWLVADGQVLAFDGDLEDYKAWMLAKDESFDDGVQARGTRKEDRRERVRRQDTLAAARRPLQAELLELEREVEQLESERAGIDRTLGGDRHDGAAIVSLHKRRAAIESRLRDSEARWYELQEALSELGKS